MQYDPSTGKLSTAVGGVTATGTDLTTHTGQRYDNDDWRVNRFLGGKVDTLKTRLKRIKQFTA